jgi:hypothetical protein
MPWLWAALAAVPVGSAVVVVATLRRVTDEVVRLERSAAAFTRVAVALDDLGHEARGLERKLGRVTRR